MKTTIDIADDLIGRAKIVQIRNEVTLRALVEEGLRLVLERYTRKIKYKYSPGVVGTPYVDGMQVPDMRQVLAEASERPWLAREFAHSAIAESVTPHSVTRKRVLAKKRKRG